MGSWGEGPLDGDTPADWFFNLKEIGLFDLIEEGLNSNDYQIVRAAVWLFAKLGESAFVYDVYVIDEHRDLALKKLEEILADEDWLNTWRDPEAVRHSLREQIREVEKPMLPGLMSKIAEHLGAPDVETEEEAG